MLAKAIIDYCALVDLPADQVRRADSAQSYHLAAELPAASLKKATKQDYDALLAAFGSGIKISVSFQSFPLLEIEGGQFSGDPSTALADVVARPDTALLSLDLQLNKPDLLTALIPHDDSCHWMLYLFAENAERLLGSNLVRIDSNIFAEKHKATIIVVSDFDAHFAGSLLTIVGEGRVNEVVANAIKHPMSKRIDRFLSSPLEAASWVGFQFRNVTPVHVTGMWIGQRSESLNGILSTQLLHLCLIYSANRTVFYEQRKEFGVQFVSSERITTVKLSPVVLSDKSAAVLPRLAIWLYVAGPDKLTVFQNVMARQLSGEDSGVGSQRLADRLPTLFDEVRWHYRVFVDQKIGAHFEELQKVNAYVSDAAKNLSDSIDSVTKGLSDTLLATVGVIVVSVLAALIENKASSEIFKISLRVYAGYLCFFIIYRMGSTLSSYSILSKDASSRLTEYKNVVGENRIKTLWKPLDRRKVQFHSWFWLTLLSYLVLALGLWVAGAAVPRLLVEHGIIKPASQSSPESKVNSKPRQGNQENSQTGSESQ